MASAENVREQLGRLTTRLELRMVSTESTDRYYCTNNKKALTAGMFMQVRGGLSVSFCASIATPDSALVWIMRGADAGRDGRTGLARPNSRPRTWTRARVIFRVQPSTSKIGNPARLIYTLAESADFTYIFLKCAALIDGVPGSGEKPLRVPKGRGIFDSLHTPLEHKERTIEAAKLCCDKFSCVLFGFLGVTRKTRLILMEAGVGSSPTRIKRGLREKPTFPKCTRGRRRSKT